MMNANVVTFVNIRVSVEHSGVPGAAIRDTGMDGENIWPPHLWNLMGCLCTRQELLGCSNLHSAYVLHLVLSECIDCDLLMN